MNWYHKLYIGETVKNRKDSIRRKVDRQDKLSKIYLIITASGNVNQLEILEPSEYYKQRRRFGETLILGLAGSMSEAMQLVRMMTEDVYRETGNVNLKDFFEKISVK